MRSISPRYFHLLNPTKLASNWAENLAGTAIPAAKNLASRNALANSINHLASYSPRVIFSRFEKGDTYTLVVPHYEGAVDAVIASWKWNDYWKPSDGYVVRIQGYTNAEITLTIGGSSLYSFTTDNDGNFVAEIEVNHTVADAETTQYIEFSQGALGIDGASTAATHIWSLVVQEKPKPILVSGDSHPAVYGIPKADYPIVSRDIEECRDTLHDIWDLHYPPVYQFASTDEDVLLAKTTQYADMEGFFITVNGTETNIIDLTSTSRTTSSPGFFVPCYGCGIGQATTVRLHCRAKIGSYNFGEGDTGNIKFIGPNGNTSISVGQLDDGIVTWKGSTSNYITLNADKDWNEATTAMNKVDILAKVDQASTGIFIAAIACWLELIP